MSTQLSNIIKITLDMLPRILRVCFAADNPLDVTGPPAVGKSQAIAQAVPDGWGFYDFRASDKEAPDIGGIPYPTESKGKKFVEYMLTRLLPWDTDEKCVILFDEFDRTSDLSVQNAMLQVILDRSLNGHRLSPNARIIIARNGETDTGTIPLTTASASRMCHVYIDAHSDKALSAWLQWAETSTVSSELQSFAKYNSDVWSQAKEMAEMEDMGSPRPRTFVMADKLWQVAHKASFETRDIILPLLAGCVGAVAGRKLLGHYEVMSKAPSPEEIVRQPKTCRLPADNAIHYALGLALAKYVSQQTASHRTGTADAIADYVARWPREQAKFAFTHLAKAEPRVMTGDIYTQWQQQNSNL